MVTTRESTKGLARRTTVDSRFRSIRRDANHGLPPIEKKREQKYTPFGGQPGNERRSSYSSDPAGARASGRLKFCGVHENLARTRARAMRAMIAS